MSAGWRLVSRLPRQVPSWVIVVLCCVTGAFPSAHASCGDHLAMPGRDSIQGFQVDSQFAIPQQMPDHSRPCHGPECRGVPFAPVPADNPAGGFTFRHVFVLSKVPDISIAEIVEAKMPDDNLLIPIGYAPRLERPPEQE